MHKWCSVYVVKLRRVVQLYRQPWILYCARTAVGSSTIVYSTLYSSTVHEGAGECSAVEYSTCMLILLHTCGTHKPKQSISLPLSGHAIWHSRNARELSEHLSQCNATSWSRARNSQVD